MVILRQSKGQVEVLLQLRSHSARMGAGSLCYPCGGVERQDHDSRDAAIRETEEETGLDMHKGIQVQPVKFDGGHADWYVMFVENEQFNQAAAWRECGDIGKVWGQLPASATHASWGHAWVPVEDMHKIRVPFFVKNMDKRANQAAQYLGLAVNRADKGGGHGYGGGKGARKGAGKGAKHA